MNFFSRLTMGFAALSLVVGLAVSPANAQSTSQLQDAFAAGNAGATNAGTGSQMGMNNTGNFTGAQTNAGGLGNGAMAQTAPALSGASLGTIGPQGTEATAVQGINTAGTVRVNNLANLEALLNIIANGMEILGIAWGGPTMIMGFMHMAAGTQDAMKRVLFGAAGVTGGLATPGCINWLVASARDANLFS